MRSRRPGTGYRVSHMGLWAAGRGGCGAGAGPGVVVTVEVVARKLFAKTGSACYLTFRSNIIVNCSFYNAY